MIWGAFGHLGAARLKSLGTFAVRWWGNMQYNLITLKMFLTVARTGSISQASEAENIAASAISKRISNFRRSDWDSTVLSANTGGLVDTSGA